jgi:peptide/nickel transport system ATP-binding protein
MSELLRVTDLKKYYKVNGGELHAVDGVTFTLEAGKTLGVVGESGCGKSTLGQVILGLTNATDGQVLFDGKDITYAKGRERRHMAKEMQMIFQDPMASLNPRFCVQELIADPLKIFHVYKDKRELEQEVYRIMDRVGLARRFAYSYPHELDGGRRQRIGIARALALKPRFIVCDEPVSALDVSIQAQVINLLQDLQEEQELAYLFITHDLSVVKHISNDILVMYIGCMVEKSGVDDLFDKPLHPYTKGLLSAIPIPSIDVERKQILLEGELSSPINPKPGCRFAPRCRYATEQCRSCQPAFEEVLPDHFVACHHVREINDL